jgi:hypothetical protein
VSARALRCKRYFPIVPQRCHSLDALDAERDAHEKIEAKS